METGNVCNLANDRLDLWWAFSTLKYASVVLAWGLRELFQWHTVSDGGLQERVDIRIHGGLVSCSRRPSSLHKGSCDAHMGEAEDLHQQVHQ